MAEKSKCKNTNQWDDINDYQITLDDNCYEKLDDSHSYIHLWNAVILQAITDATTNYKRTENRMEKIRATTWLLQNNTDFPLICHLAGHSPSYVRTKAIAAIEKTKKAKNNQKIN